MIPAGYLLKRPKPPEDWLKASQVTLICSLSECVNPNVVDVEKVWMHNAFGLANDPETLWRLAEEDGTDILDTELFYYEAYEQEAESDSDGFEISDWQPLTKVPSAGVAGKVAKPSAALQLLGYDVVTSEDYLEHSPLACNHVAESISVNEYCLFSDLSQAKDAIESGAFDGCEPGIYKIYAVYRVNDGSIDPHEQAPQR